MSNVVGDKPSFTLVRGENYLALPRDPQPWLVDKLVPSGGVMLVGGAPKEGKSFMALGIAVAIANPQCTSFLGRDVLKHGPVIYLQVDTPREEWASRIERIKGEGIDNIYWSDANLVPYPLTITDGAIKYALTQKLRELHPVLLVVDTLREVHNDDENDNTAMKRVITALVEVTRETNTTLLMVAHTRKHNAVKRGEEYEINLVDDIRGANYVAGRCDIISIMSKGRFILTGRSIGNKAYAVEQNPLTLLWGMKDSTVEIGAALDYVMQAPELKNADDRLAMLMAQVPTLSKDDAIERMQSWKPKPKPTS